MNTALETALIGADGRPRFGLYRSPLTSLRVEGFRLQGAKGPGPANLLELGFRRRFRQAG